MNNSKQFQTKFEQQQTISNLNIHLESIYSPKIIEALTLSIKALS